MVCSPKGDRGAISRPISRLRWMWRSAQPMNRSQLVETTSALEPTINLFGIAETLHTSGTIDRTNPFFQALGTNPRTCETCHSAAEGWTTNSLGNALLFLTSLGTDPLFNLVDNGTRPDADISSFSARVNTFVDHAGPARGDALHADGQPDGRVHARRGQRSVRVFDHHRVLRAFGVRAPTANETKVVEHSLDRDPDHQTCSRSWKVSCPAPCACMNSVTRPIRRRQTRRPRRAISWSA